MLTLTATVYKYRRYAPLMMVIIAIVTVNCFIAAIIEYPLIQGPEQFHSLSGLCCLCSSIFLGKMRVKKHFEKLIDAAVNT